MCAGLIFKMENEKLHFHHVMLYEFKKGVSVGTVTKNIQDIYLDRAPALRTVKMWFSRFQSGDFNLNDKLRSGRPSGINNDFIRDLVNNNATVEKKCNRLKDYIQGISESLS